MVMSHRRVSSILPFRQALTNIGVSFAEGAAGVESYKEVRKAPNLCGQVHPAL
jgi:hypothetical protein